MSLKQNLLKVVDTALELAKECGETIEVRSAIVKLQQAKNAVMQLDDDAVEIPKVQPEPFEDVITPSTPSTPIVEETEEIVTGEVAEEDTGEEE